MTTNYKLLCKKQNGENIIDTILKSRGIFNKSDFFDPEIKNLSSPFYFSDMKKAVDIIKNAVKNSDRILIWGDFDADGVTSTSILYKTLKKLGANFSYFLPDRINMGHGLNLKELLLQKSKNNIKVLITVDCGISNIKEIELMKTMGVKTIITDHHEPLTMLPCADCILNPLAENALKEDLSAADIEKISYMSGAGVAMKLAFALLENENNCTDSFKEELIALSAVGTISDVVPLTGENRIIAAKGLKAINNGINKGIKRFFEKQNITKKLKSDDIAFILTPRINAAGRLDSPFESIKLLIEENDLVIDVAIEKLDALNKIRQNLCDKIYEETLSMIGRPKSSIVLFNETWHLGIIGIVASKLVEKFNVPVFLITKDDKNIYRSSVRGTNAFDISKILSSLKDCFIGFGGHKMAGGFSADTNFIDIETLKKRIEEAVLDDKDNSKEGNFIEIDMELNGKDINTDFIKELDKLEPFGASNKKPVFLFKDAKLTGKKVIGKDLNHMTYTVAKDNENFSCLYWKRPILGFEINENLDIVFRPEINSYNEEEKIQLITECILNDKIKSDNTYKTKIFDHRQKMGILDKIEKYVGGKNGEVKIWATSINTRKMLEKYSSIKKNIITSPLNNEKSLMLFDYPPNSDDFKEIIRQISPLNLHIMNSGFSKNPDDYISLICGMIKYASNNKNGEIDIKTIAYNTGLDEICVQTALELLEKIESIRIDDINKIEFLKPPKLETIHNDSYFEIFMDEFNRVLKFKEYLETADTNSLETICAQAF